MPVNHQIVTRLAITAAVALAIAACGNHVERVYGKGIDAYSAENYAEAKIWIGQAAEAGSVDGMSIYGAMYLFGRGVPQDNAKAVYWFTRAADLGRVDAQSILGIMYATGQGVGRDLEKARFWLDKAARKGDKQAIKMLAIISPGKSI